MYHRDANTLLVLREKGNSSRRNAYLSIMVSRKREINYEKGVKIEKLK